MVYWCEKCEEEHLGTCPWTIVDEVRSKNREHIREIWRLRKKEKHLLKSRDDLFERIEGLDQEVERLCIDNVELTDEIADLGDQLERCTAHVGELELEAEGSHNITNAKIDAAWNYYNNLHPELEADEIFACEEMFRLLGFERGGDDE